MERTRKKIIEGSTEVAMARIRDVAGQFLSPGNVESLSAVMVNEKTGTRQPIDIIIPDCVYPTMQTDVRWTRDSIGYNFALVLEGQYFPDGDTPYRLEVTMKTTGQPEFKELWLYQTIDVSEDE